MLAFAIYFKRSQRKTSLHIRKVNPENA